jgi:putative transposase
MPRQVAPGRSYMLTRRCTQRKFLLTPRKEMQQAFWYCFAVAVRRFNIRVLSVVAMGNHYHATIEDPDGSYPEFTRYFHSLLARCGNVLLGRWENFWDPEQSGVLELVDPDTSFRKMVYTLTNPVQDHLVQKACHWPGASSLIYQLNDSALTVKRPRKFFCEDGCMPDEVTIRFQRPRGFEHLSHDEWTEKLRAAINGEEKKAAANRRETGRKLLGRKAVRRQTPFSQPSTFAKRRGIVPRIATRNKWLRIERLEHNKRFQQRYRDAFARRTGGEPDAVFPYGTYKLRVLNLVDCDCARPPPS